MKVGEYYEKIMNANDRSHLEHLAYMQGMITKKITMQGQSFMWKGTNVKLTQKLNLTGQGFISPVQKKQKQIHRQHMTSIKKTVLQFMGDS